MALMGRIDYLYNTFSYIDILHYYGKIEEFEETEEGYILKWKDGYISKITYSDFVDLVRIIRDFGGTLSQRCTNLYNFLTGKTFVLVDINYSRFVAGSESFVTICDEKFMKEELELYNVAVENKKVDYSLKIKPKIIRYGNNI